MDEVWLVGRGVASAHEVSVAAQPRDAVAYFRWAVRGSAAASHFDGVAEAVADGRVLLVFEGSADAAVDVVGPEPVDLLDAFELVEPEPLELPPEVEPPPAHFIELVVIDAMGEPQAGMDYALTLPDGTTLSGHTDSAGVVRLTLDQAGACDLTFPELESADSAPQQAVA